jgi:hydroxymethylglutaryl-CoA lyase
MLDQMGINTGIDLQKLIGAAKLAQQIVGGDLPSHVLKAGPVSWLPSGDGSVTAETRT